MRFRLRYGRSDVQAFGVLLMKIVSVVNSTLTRLVLPHLRPDLLGHRSPRIKRDYLPSLLIVLLALTISVAEPSWLWREHKRGLQNMSECLDRYSTAWIPLKPCDEIRTCVFVKSGLQSGRNCPIAMLNALNIEYDPECAPIELRMGRFDLIREQTTGPRSLAEAMLRSSIRCMPHRKS